MEGLEYIIVVLSAILVFVQGQGQPIEEIPLKHHRLRDKAHVQDKKHIMEHYDGVLESPEEMSENEMNFHYFKVHDYDNNNMLDGIELVAAITHYHKDESEPNDVVPDRLSDDDLTWEIDDLLDESDKNKDGYITYFEYQEMVRLGGEIPNIQTM